MAERKTYTAEDFKGCNGRRVIIGGKGVIQDSAPEKCHNILVLLASGELVALPRSAIVEILPQEIKAGDMVSRKNYPGPVKVLAIQEGRAWILEPDGRRGDWAVEHLTLVEGAR